MSTNLEIGICSLKPESLVLERKLIRFIGPVLNLTWWKNPDREEIRGLRKICADEARSSAERGSAGHAGKKIS